MDEERIKGVMSEYVEPVEDTIYMLKPYLFEGISYCLPTNSSPELRRHIDAAILLYKDNDLEFINGRSVLESLDINYYKPNSIDIVQDSVVKSVMFLANLLNRIESCHTNLNIGQQSFFVAMMRLKATFQSAVILLRYGYFIEVSTIFRLIYEQLGWACFVIEQNHINQIKCKSVTKTIRYLQKINKEYPKLYSLYSKEAHIDPSKIADYLREDSAGIRVLSRSGEECKKKTMDLILLIKIYAEIINYSIEKHLVLDDDKREEFQEIINVSLQGINYTYQMFSGSNDIKLHYTNLL